MKGYQYVLLAVGAFLLCVAGCSTMQTHVTATGTKVGTVIKVANEGAIVKTWEVELVRGGMSNGSGGFSTTPLHATINDEKLLAQAQEALDQQYEVEVTYVTYWGPMPFASANTDDRFLLTMRRR